MTPRFHVTHEITHDGRTIPVMCSDGALYTRAEWRACIAADWELDAHGTLLFQGSVPLGSYVLRLLERPPVRGRVRA